VGASLAVGGAVAGCGRTDQGHDESHTAVVRAQINGEHREFTVDNRMSLLDMLREQAGLPGTKKGCAWRSFSSGCGRSMLQRCPRSLRSSASSTTRLVTPRATPVSTTTDGR
jgi:hypothetical protein